MKITTIILNLFMSYSSAKFEVELDRKSTLQPRDWGKLKEVPEGAILDQSDELYYESSGHPVDVNLINNMNA